MIHALGRANSFNLLRLAGACAVVFTHSLRLFGLGTDPTLIVFPDDLSSFGVLVFFSISGYLVLRSAYNSQGLLQYARKRALRILPGLAACLLFTVIVIGALATKHDLGSYYTDWRTWKYLLNTLMFPLQTELPGVFQENPRPGTVNGSLWTLSSEVIAYTLIVLAVIWRRGSGITIALGFVALFTFFTYQRTTGAFPLLAYQVETSDNQPYFLLYFNYVEASRLICAFAFGAFLNFVPASALSAKLAAPLFLALPLSVGTPFYDLVLVVVIPYAVVSFGRLPSSLSTRLNDLDLSYGLYLYHAPAMQLTWTLTHEYLDPLAQLATGVALSIGLAFMSWRFIERPALSMTELRTSRRTAPG